LQQEVEVGVFDVVIDWVELLEAFQDAFYPAIYLGAFDKCEHNRNASYWQLEAWYSLISHHIYLEFSDECISASSVTIKDEWGNARRF